MEHNLDYGYLTEWAENLDLVVDFSEILTQAGIWKIAFPSLKKWKIIRVYLHLSTFNFTLFELNSYIVDNILISVFIKDKLRIEIDTAKPIQPFWL